MPVLPSTLDNPPAVAPYFDGSQACKANPEGWFPPRGDNRATRVAKRACGHCPFARPCLDYALADPQLYGVWGGTTYDDRKEIRREQANARRRAAQVATAA
jgi:hypothetical protein